MSMLKTCAIGATTLLALMSAAAAEPITIEVAHPWPAHNRFHDPIAEEFMKLHPDIKIHFRAPAANYMDGHQEILREALTKTLPDVWHTGYHMLPELVHTLSERGEIAELTPFMTAEGDAWVKANYSQDVLKHGQVDGKQWGMPFNASTPIVFYNLDLVTKAGGDPANLPTDWEGVIALAKKIRATGGNVDGMAYEASEWGDDYLWQAIVYNFNGEMMNEAKTKVTFDSEAGLKAVTLLRRFVTETEMPFLNEDQAEQQFVAGKLGIFVTSTSAVRGFKSAIGENFKWKTTGYPIADKQHGGVTTGGNAMVILTQDPAKQKAAWEYVKFATGPEGQKIAVLGSGYMPTNLQAEGPDYLGKFYAENPDWTTSVKQWPVARKWFGYPGNTGVRIWREQKAILAQIMRGEVTPEAGLKTLTETTQSLCAIN